MKKTLVLLMVCILALSMPAAVSAAAASNLKISAVYREPQIKVEVPTVGQLYLNPKKIPMEINGRVSDAQIISDPWSIENQSECAVSVNVELYAKVNAKSGMKLEIVPQADSISQLKRAFIYLDRQVTDPGTDLSSLTWPQIGPDDEGIIYVTTNTRLRKNVLTLEGLDETGNVSPGSVGVFRLSGDAVENPKEEWNPSVDYLTVNLTYTFQPTDHPAA